MSSINNINEKVTILIVTFKSHHIIEKCLDNIDKKFNIILIENSNDLDFTFKLKKKYKNLKCINIGYDSGFGYALNRGVEKVNTDYFIAMNPDTFPEEGCLEKLLETVENYNDIAMVTPLTLLNKNSKEFSAYGNFDNKKLLKNSKNIMEVNWVNGNIFLMNKKIFMDIGGFDEKIFIEYDERELQRRIYLSKKKILIDFNAKSHHLDGKSADEKFAFEMKCEKSWHNAWSGFYYYKKHFGYIHALNKSLPFAISNFLKFIYFFITRDVRKSEIYRLFFLGFINSLFNRKSFYRAEID